MAGRSGAGSGQPDQARIRPRGARLPGILPGHIIDTIGEQLAGSLEIDATLQHVAEKLVPRFADHCYIDLFQGDALICRVRRHADGWTPPGTWKQVASQVAVAIDHAITVPGRAPDRAGPSIAPATSWPLPSVK